MIRRSILFGIVGIFALILFGYMHEKVHQSIFESYGIESRIEFFSEFPDFVTIAEKPCPNVTCGLSHSINESVGYHLAPIYLLLFTGLISLIVLSERRNLMIERLLEVAVNENE